MTSYRSVGQLVRVEAYRMNSRVSFASFEASRRLQIIIHYSQKLGSINWSRFKTYLDTGLIEENDLLLLLVSIALFVATRRVDSKVEQSGSLNLWEAKSPNNGTA